MVRRYPSTGSGAEFLSVSSGTSRDVYGHCTGRQGYGDSIAPFTSMGMYPDSSKIYKW